MKSASFAIIAAFLIIAPAIESEWWRSWLRSLDTTISLLVEDASIEEFVSAPHHAHRSKIAILREKLLERDQQISVTLLNTEPDLRRLVAAELFPVRIDPSALVAIQLEPASGSLAILPNPRTKRRTEQTADR